MLSHVGVLSISQLIRHNQTHKYKIITTTYRKLLYGMTGSTQGADAPLVCTGYPCNENK